MIEITLSSDEILAGVVVAAQRKITSDRRESEGRNGRAPNHYEGRHDWDTTIEATLAEMAVARWRNRYWSGSFFRLETPGSDVGHGGQVRWTHHVTGSLIVYEEDANDHAFVLVTGYSPTMKIIGWIPATEAKQGSYWREDVLCPSWWVPQEDLKPIYDTATR